MDWLDEIEADFQALRDEGLLDEDDDSVRMARVLRELAKVAKHVRENIMCVEVYDVGPIGYEFDEVFSDLSDDAKELLDVA